ncbi:hypothetical protein AMTR_s00074p00108470 [Amborella trichopoda]|uniref:Uncharacterized protein n=1 Tax=Amborella trichopoda TaxID=13333 RepID=W1NMY4_AMBTC|nr:hypothetical protein AMTR_s00074p00108470 [Amborella trichopoda]
MVGHYRQEREGWSQVSKRGWQKRRRWGRKRAAELREQAAMVRGGSCKLEKRMGEKDWKGWSMAVNGVIECTRQVAATKVGMRNGEANVATER